jgi:hypothetical protein
MSVFDPFLTLVERSLSIRSGQGAGLLAAAEGTEGLLL